MNKPVGEPKGQMGHLDPGPFFYHWFTYVFPCLAFCLTLFSAECFSIWHEHAVNFAQVDAYDSQRGALYAHCQHFTHKEELCST